MCLFHIHQYTYYDNLVNLQDVRKGLAELRDGLKRIRTELAEYFTDPETNDKYGTQMWTFVGRATEQMEDLTDDVRNAETTFTEAIGYYGEEDKNMSSSEFYGIFKTFVTSYKVGFTFSKSAYILMTAYRNARQITKRHWKRR